MQPDPTKAAIDAASAGIVAAVYHRQADWLPMALVGIDLYQLKKVLEHEVSARLREVLSAE